MPNYHNLSKMCIVELLFLLAHLDKQQSGLDCISLVIEFWYLQEEGLFRR